jgi:GTPase SAR1 family protein
MTTIPHRSRARPLTVLVIGPSQNGKSTFINRLIGLAVNEVTLAKEGDGNFKCTSACTVYSLEVPLTDYKLVTMDDKDYELPDLKDEEKILGGAWWKKQTRMKYAIKPCKRHGPVIQLRLIDTPGLDDSEGKDFENMKDVLGTLNTMAQSPVKWEREIDALALVYNANSPFSYTFQKTLKDYQQCMPNLFGGLSVINTNFNVTAWAQKRQHLIREKLLGPSETSKTRIVKERRQEFSKILGLNPTHFFIDNKPKNSLMFDEWVSCNTISDILNFWSNSKPMPIGQMRLVKNDDMLAADKELQSLLNFSIGQWESEKRDVLKTVSKNEGMRSYFEQQHQELSDDLTRLEKDLEIYDNNSEFTIQKYTTQDDETAPALFAKWAFRVKIKNSFYVKEPKYGEFQVDAKDGVHDRWVSTSYDRSENSWTGQYQAKPGKIPRLTVRTFTTNRVFHQDTISSLRTQLRRTRASLAENEAKSEDLVEKKEGEKSQRLDTLVECITASKDMIEILGAESPPLDASFDEASRIRYSKSPGTVNATDLLNLVKIVKPNLENPLKEILRLRY